MSNDSSKLLREFAAIQVTATGDTAGEFIDEPIVS
jgi:hypothetical protein